MVAGAGDVVRSTAVQTQTNFNFHRFELLISEKSSNHVSESRQATSHIIITIESRETLYHIELEHFRVFQMFIVQC